MITDYMNQTGTYYLSYIIPSHWINSWVLALAVFIFFFAVSKLFVYVIQKFVLALTKKTETEFDDMMVEKTNKPISWILIFIGIRIAIEILAYQNNVMDTVTRINDSLIYFSTIYLAMAVTIVFIDHWGTKFTKKSKSKMDDILLPLFRKTVQVIAFIMMAVIILDEWGVNIAGILAGVGIAGLALGFAIKDSLANIFGGISMILSKTFHVGDKIEVEGITGNIIEVGIRATRIKTFDNELVIIPNGTMATAIIKNYHQPNHRARVVVPFGVEYGVKLEKVEKVITEEVVKKLRDIEKKDPKPQIVFKEMADSSLNFELKFWVDDVDMVWAKKFETNKLIYNALNKAKIGIPFPCVTVYKGK